MLVTTACGDDGASGPEDTESAGTTTSTSMTSMTSMTASDSGSSGDPPATTEGGASGSSGAADEGSSSGGDAGTTDDGGSTGVDSGSTGGDSTGAGACAPIAFTIVDEPGFTGDGFCEGVQDNAVLADARAVADHTAQWCASLVGCVFPEPPCDPVPALPADGEQIVYVFGMDDGCSASAAISEILDCGDTIEVHYDVFGIGMCGAVLHAWAAAAIPASDAEIVFVPG